MYIDKHSGLNGVHWQTQWVEFEILLKTNVKNTTNVIVDYGSHVHKHIHKQNNEQT